MQWCLMYTASIQEPGRSFTECMHNAVEALYDYTEMNEDELTLRKGDVVYVTEKSDPRWWMGVLNRKQGLFPANYVTVVSDSRSIDPDMSAEPPLGRDGEKGSENLLLPPSQSQSLEPNTDPEYHYLEKGNLHFDPLVYVLSMYHQPY